MSKTSQLPIYKTTYDVLLRIMQITHNFPKEYKYTLGEKIQREVIDIVVNVYQTYNKGDKKYLEDLKERVELTFLYLRISHDMHLLNADKYAELIEQLDNILQQATNWQKSLLNKAGA